MKTCLFVFAALIAIFTVGACNDILENIKDGTKPAPIENPTHDELLKGNNDARVRYQEHIELCGEDVVLDCGETDVDCPKPGTGGNYLPTTLGCNYRIRLDSGFLTHEQLKTGFEFDEKLFYQAVYTQPSTKDLSLVTEKWSLLDFGRAAQVAVNRQTCGDCWSQATTKGLELIIAAKTNKIVNLAVQTQISRCSNHGSCGGGYMSAPDFLVKHGNPLETEDNYQGRNSNCKFSNTEITAGFEHKPETAPWVGTSLANSRYFSEGRNGGREGAKVKAIKAMMIKYRSPAVVTIAAISSSGGTINKCSRINSQGNHMQDIVAWNKNVVDVWNSWGKSHGNNGITRLVWECGEGKLNRGVGRSARVYEYKGCDTPADPYTGGDKTFIKTSPDHGVWIGRKPSNDQTCEITPTEGLSDFDESGCRAFSSPTRTVEYHIKAYVEECDDTKSAMVLITPLIPGNNKRNIILTPHGVVDLNIGVANER